MAHTGLSGHAHTGHWGNRGLQAAFTLLILSSAALPVAGQSSISARPSEATFAGFGAAVAVGDGEVFVGESRNTLRPGIVYVYRRDGSRWTELTQLKAPDATYGDGFGSGLAIDGPTLVVGAASQNAIFVFQKEASGTWRQTAKLAPADLAPNTGFGGAIALNGDVLLAGASGADNGTGVVHIFRRSAGGQWSESGRITAPDAAARDVFGGAIAFDGTRAAIGAPGRNGSSGVVFVFTHQNGTFTRSGTITVPVRQPPRGGGPGQQPQTPPAPPQAAFGVAVHLEGDMLYVGAPVLDLVGSVFLYSWNAQNSTWSPAGRLLPFDGMAPQQFGANVATSGNTVLVGAPGGFGGNRGSLYVFERDAGNASWIGARRVFAPDASRGGSFATAVEVSGSTIIVGAAGQDAGAGTAVIYDIDTNSGEWTGSPVESPAEALPAITGDKVDCTEGKVNALFECGQIDLMGFLPVSAIGGGRGIGINDIWGWTDPQSNKEYALVGRQDGTAFVDMTDPSNPVYVGEVKKTAGSPNASWRDIKVYRDHAYIVADASGNHGMQVFDLTRLREYSGTPITFEPHTTYTNIASAHNIVINEESGFAYPVGSGGGGETCGGGLHMIDIRDPKNPEFAGCFADPLTGRAGTGYSHDAQCVMYKGPDAQYQGREICLGSNETMLSIADVTDKADPKAVSRISYPNVAYAHQGWLTDDHRYFLMNDEGDESTAARSPNGPMPGTRTLIWDLTDLDDPQLIKEHYGTTKSIDHNLYIKGNLVYESNYTSGLRILDISDIRNPREVGFFDTVPWGGNDTPSFAGSWSNYPYFESGNIAVTSIREGLFIVRYRQPRPVS